MLQLRMACVSRIARLPTSALTCAVCSAALVGSVCESSYPSRSRCRPSRIARCSDPKEARPEWRLVDHHLPEEAPLELWEGTRLFADGSGVHVWPAAACLVEYLRWHGVPDGSPGSLKANCRGRRVMEMGCGCGLVAVCLARWGAEVVAVDYSDAALALTEANAAHNLTEEQRSRLLVERLDWNDAASCTRLREESGPFTAIVAADCVLARPPAGPMWRRVGLKAVPPGSLLDATHWLADSNTEVVLVVADRVDDVRDTARALLERREDVQLVAMPQDVVLGGGGKATVFHFKWKSAPRDVPRAVASE